ncbi:hypothetical protein ACO0K3_04560 [Undibacterium sp. Rencai35W]|uniref:hypothetical protein n=1 Tax=Undibacterium sp. Rencai35W TaxID=3413046 RepID=UPI003BF1756F
MKDVNQTPPSRMTAEQRCSEVAHYLARGIVRLRNTNLAKSARHGAESDFVLGFSGDQSVHDNPSTRKPEFK